MSPAFDQTVISSSLSEIQKYESLPDEKMPDDFEVDDSEIVSRFKRRRKATSVLSSSETDGSQFSFRLGLSKKKSSMRDKSYTNIHGNSLRN